jgi:hypothetical protein
MPLSPAVFVMAAMASGSAHSITAGDFPSAASGIDTIKGQEQVFSQAHNTANALALLLQFESMYH